MPFELNQNVLEKSKHGPYNLLENVATNTAKSFELALKELNLQFQVTVLRKGTHEFTDLNGLDHWLWQMKGTSSVTLSSDQFSYDLNEYDSLVLPENYSNEMTINVVGGDDFILKITQNPKLKV